MNNVSDIATDCALKRTQKTGSPGAALTRAGSPVRPTAEGARDGVTIRVVIERGRGKHHGTPGDAMTAAMGSSDIEETLWRALKVVGVCRRWA